MKIKNQLILTHGLLVFLALLIVFINTIAYKDMENDANIVNQAGKLRMLSYNMAQLSNQITIEKNESARNQLTSKLKSRINEFEMVLMRLSEESGSKDSVVTQHLLSSVKLETINRDWLHLFKPAFLGVVSNNLDVESLVNINDDIDSYVNVINEMVALLSANSKGKITRALMFNGGLILIIIIVSWYSFISTNNRIRKPIQVLMQELKALSLIDDDISRKFKYISTDEISEMTQYFNEMMYDQLTKTFNRRAGLAKLNRKILQENKRHLKLSLCFIDINGLKEVNDQLGHQFGDELIISAVEGIKQEIRSDDFIIRMGGDEFLIVFNGIDQVIAEKVWERINQSYNWINENEERRYFISVSHGIVDFDNDELSEVELLIKAADDKMYVEKKFIKEALNVKIIKK